MPVMSNTPKVTNDTSSLSDGWHPAFLLEIREEDTPPTATAKERAKLREKSCRRG